MLEKMARTLGIYERCNFLGEVPAGELVRRVLDQSDIFVLPSRVEGLPRAIIEAMARGLPCIGSTVGGIPELLPTEDLVKPGDVDGLAALIREVMADPARQKRMSIRNLAESRKYADDLLKSKRIAFYQGVKDITASHLWAKFASTAGRKDLTAVHGPAALSRSNN
jgi:glycosyltransferase involved in cell wall biosynthesis